MSTSDDNNDVLYISTELLEHPIWTRDKFNKVAAFIDLVGRASIESRKASIIHNTKNHLDAQSGQLHTSYEQLATRWHWELKDVKHFISQLRRRKIIAIEKTTFGILITFTNGNSHGRTK